MSPLGYIRSLFLKSCRFSQQIIFLLFQLLYLCVFHRLSASPDDSSCILIRDTGLTVHIGRPDFHKLILNPAPGATGELPGIFRFFLVQPGIHLNGFIDQCLYLCLKKQHPYVFFCLLRQHIVPLCYRIIITESLAVLAVHLLTLLLLFLLCAAEVLETFAGSINLKAGLDHLCSALRFYLHTLLCFLRCFLLCIRKFIPGYNHTCYDYRQTKGKRSHECRGCCIGYTQGCCKPIICSR